MNHANIYQPTHPTNAGPTGGRVPGLGSARGSHQDLPCKGRTKEAQGDILAPGDLMVELQDLGALKVATNSGIRLFYFDRGF